MPDLCVPPTNGKENEMNDCSWRKSVLQTSSQLRAPVCENEYAVMTRNGLGWRQDYMVKTYRPYNFPWDVDTYKGWCGYNTYAFVAVPHPTIGAEMERVFEYFNSVPIDVLWETSFRHGVITKLFLARDPIPAAFHEIVCRALLAIETPFDAVLED